MIRFCDGYVISVDKGQYTRDVLFHTILVDSLQNYVFELQDETESYIITYYDLLYDISSFEDLQHRTKIIYDKDVFDNCNAFFEKNPKHCFVPVFNSNEEIMYLAYQDNRDAVMNIQLLGAFRTLQKKAYVNLCEVFEQIKGVDLYDVNELSYEIYLYLKTNNIPYKLYGEQWELLGDEYEQEMKKRLSISKQEVISFYGDLKDTLPPSTTALSFFKRKSVIEQYRVLYLLINANYNKAIYETSKLLKEKCVRTIIVKIPEAEELKNLSESERYSLEHAINMNQYFQISSEEEWTNLYEIYGKTLYEQYVAGNTLKDRFVDVMGGVNHYSVVREKKRKNIYLCGPCITFQSDLMPEDTLVARIQKLVDTKYPDEYEVSSFVIPIEEFDKFEKIISRIEIYSEDIFVFMYNGLQEQAAINYIDLTAFFDSRGEERYFSNHPIHVNQIGSRKLAQYFFDMVLASNISANEAKCISCASELESKEQIWIDSFILSYGEYIHEGHNGAIVMNCNPYTKGHEALIEEAAAQVDHLYIFVVEEDASFFSFEDRFALVRKNTEHFINVYVLPSGNAVISKETFPTYFQKENIQNERIDASLDIKLFGLGIAPAFHIEKRFVGEEPLDYITRQYNEAMKEQLPAYGIKLIEIPRKETDGAVISASMVRKCLKEKQYERIGRMVPEATWDYLEKKYILHIDDEKNKDVDLSKDICLFGLGAYFMDHKEIWNRFDIKLLCDNDQKKWGTEINGVKCVSPKELQQYKNMLVIIMIKDYENVYNQLKLLSVDSVPYSKIKETG